MLVEVHAVVNPQDVERLPVPDADDWLHVAQAEGDGRVVPHPGRTLVLQLRFVLESTAVTAIHLSFMAISGKASATGTHFYYTPPAGVPSAASTLILARSKTCRARSRIAPISFRDTKSA